MPWAAKKMARAIVRVMSPARGRHTRKAPTRIANTALIRVHTKPGTLRVVNKAASPTNPPVRKSHPANVSTTSVAMKGETAARRPRMTMTTPGIRKRIQWRRMADLASRRKSSRFVVAPWLPLFACCARQDRGHQLRRCLSGGRSLAPELTKDVGRKRNIGNKQRPRGQVVGRDLLFQNADELAHAAPSRRR